MQNKLRTNLTPINRGVNLTVTALMIAGLGMVTIPTMASASINDTVIAKVNPYMLERKNGVQRVYQSLEKQAEQACRSGGLISLLDKQLSAKCTKILLSEFVLDLNDVRVTAHHQREISQ